ncbi:MAG: 2-amino-4-hydroxy-6-hydroxymethyldihydropteridine diphosphokinase [Gammaproteobacteria bacterium TMED222]|jgi:2-amino-4-hydroxy-6-hydroxymethyldihydropteridine diphosphokinase|nr:MAG: 2-amino-4-hydroxy-6-hydroxymethyldihydropteridine diphosphokinase [Gammaproteobacteria bacterium TMED222]|tara:strand:- start:7864 stop:8304 length:441 start_codon:yes stop_codon:yes gene_type:complete
MSSNIAYLVLGTNLGNRYRNLFKARLEINELPETKILKKSKIFKSPFYGPIKQPFFFNLALEIETKLTPMMLLENLQKIEKKLKRERNSHMKPRTIDIDIIFYNDEIIEMPLLKVPHYDWQNRDFFIKPLREINCKAEQFKNFSFG